MIDCIDHGFPGNKPQGYHQLRVKGKLRYVHRLAFATHHNREEGELEIIRHLCHNPRCVNPLHLAEGTHQDNANDRVAAGRSAKKVPSRYKLTEEQVSYIKLNYKKGSWKAGARPLSRALGVSSSPIYRVIEGLR